MRPPLCDVCGANASGDSGSVGGGLVTFKPLPSDVEWRERANRGEIVGHPPNAAWLCARHAPPGRDLAGTHALGPALAKIHAADAPLAKASKFDIGAVERRLRDVFAQVAASVGLAEAPVSTTADRTWTPMDGAEPPNCPYVDTSTRTAAQGEKSLVLTFERAHWNDADVASAGVTLAARGCGDRSDFRVSVHTPDDAGGPGSTHVTLVGRAPAVVVKALDDLDVALPKT